MINSKKFNKFLKYIGIDNTETRSNIIIYYKLCYKNMYSASVFKRFIEELGYEEGCADTIVDYIVFPQNRELYDEEVSIYGKECWSKSFQEGL